MGRRGMVKDICRKKGQHYTSSITITMSKQELIRRNEMVDVDYEVIERK